jgi:hypothetical protein
LRASASELAGVEQTCVGAMSVLSLYQHSALPSASRIELQCIFLETLLVGRVIRFRGDHVLTALICELALNCAARCLDFRPEPKSHLAGGERQKTLLECRLCGRVPRPRVPASASRSARMPRKWRDTGVKMRPGASVMAHPRGRVAVGCHQQLAQRCTSCSAVLRALLSSPQEGQTFRPLAFSPRTLGALWRSCPARFSHQLHPLCHPLHPLACFCLESGNPSAFLPFPSNPESGTCCCCCHTRTFSFLVGTLVFRRHPGLGVTCSSNPYPMNPPRLGRRIPSQDMSFYGEV